MASSLAYIKAQVEANALTQQYRCKPSDELSCFSFRTCMLPGKGLKDLPQTPNPGSFHKYIMAQVLPVNDVALPPDQHKSCLKRTRVCLMMRLLAKTSAALHASILPLEL